MAQEVNYEEEEIDETEDDRKIIMNTYKLFKI